jgi:hypothetical protein
MKKSISKKRAKFDFRRRVSPLIPPPRVGWAGNPALEPGRLEEVDSYDAGMLWKGLNSAKVLGVSFSRSWPHWYS